MVGVGVCNQIRPAGRTCRRSRICPAPVSWWDSVTALGSRPGEHGVHAGQLQALIRRAVFLQKSTHHTRLKIARAPAPGAVAGVQLWAALLGLGGASHLTGLSPASTPPPAPRPDLEQEGLEFMF